jgi:16S rRNA U1498 N3-methylase RsmE
MTLLSTSLLQAFGYRPMFARKQTLSMTRRFLNRIMFEQDEVSGDDLLLVRLNAEDYRSEHLIKILKCKEGDRFKGGIIDIGMTNGAKIVGINYNAVKGNEGRASQRSKVVAKAEAKAKAVTKSLYRSDGSSSIDEEPFMTLSLGPRSALQTNVAAPPVDLIMACPRPLRLERLLPVVTSIGVRNLAIVGAEKVEKGFFGSHLFRRPAALRLCLEEGLSQTCTDYHAPWVVIERSLFKFLGPLPPVPDDSSSNNGDVAQSTSPLDALFPPNECLRIIAHPPTPSDSGSQGSSTSSSRLDLQALGSRRMLEIPPPPTGANRVVVAVGPEGGWTDNELRAFLARGFIPVHLGERILRTDVATPALLALAHEWAALHGKCR